MAPFFASLYDTFDMLEGVNLATNIRLSLRKIAEEQETSIAELVRATVEREGSIFRAALALGLTPNSLQNWMSRNGYRLRQTVTVVQVDAPRDKRTE